MANRPIIVGLYNPHSADLANALAPTPPGSSGHRLWSMLKDVDNEASKIYRHLFDRRNLVVLDGDVGKPRRYQDLAARMRRTFCPGDNVVLLGQEVCAAFSSNLSQPIARIPIHPQVIDEVIWRVLPHPSGRSLIYNDLVFRRLAGMLLSDLARE